MIPNGVYHLVSWQSTNCMSIAEAVRFTATGTNAYALEVAATLQGTPLRVNATASTSGTTITTTQTCPSPKSPDTSSYSVYQQNGKDYLRVVSATNGVSVFERVQ